MSNTNLAEELWTPQLAGRTPMDKYRRHINSRFDQDLKTTADLQKWTCQDPQNFWMDLYSYLNFQPPLPNSITRAYDDRVPISANPLFFEGLSMNYAENAIFANPDPNAIALVGLREGMDLDDGETLTWYQFREKVRATTSALRRSGIQKGDRVAALVATGNWAMILFHASAAIGAIFTCVSPELGLEGCVSRLQQVMPRILFVDSDTVYKGKTVSTAEKLGQIVERLVNEPLVFIVPITSGRVSFETIDSFLAKARPDDKLEFAKVSFNDPLMICYSSGTTGAPKCIVHRHGILLQLKKISAIHNSTTPQDVILQYSSTSWVVFYIMCGYFACGATTIVYNGSPMYPDVSRLLKMAAHFRVTYFGISPRYLLEVEMAKVVPRNSFDLSALRIVYTTGATLSPEQYRWFYSSFPSSVHLCNTAGGTDTATSLIAADSCAPVRAGEMQVFALGMDVDVADPDSGASIMHTGEAGEMVIRKPFPSMPCFFWGDKGCKIYHESYFERFSNIDVWAQHDWLACNPRTGGYVMSGRSDGVLNPSGIRFGSGEIYAIVESAPLNGYISNSLCVGRRRPQDQDEEVFLFLVMAPPFVLTPELRNRVKTAVRNNLSARHVPKFVLQVPAIPVTINGKKAETPVKKVISGKDVIPSATISNPESVMWFRRFREMESEPKGAKL